ncbi:MAG: hypothetical protein AB7F43_13485 [Bacteriovoracia bacterium]
MIEDRLKKLAKTPPQVLGFVGLSNKKEEYAKLLYRLVNGDSAHLVDYVEIKPHGDQILVEDLRDLRKTLYFAPVSAKKRFIIIHDAHRMNLASSNSILKILEEPPNHTRFILFVPDRSLLLDTIQSRTFFIYLPNTHEIEIHPVDSIELDNLEQSILYQTKKFCQIAVQACHEGNLEEAWLHSTKALQAQRLWQRFNHHANKKLILQATREISK